RGYTKRRSTDSDIKRAGCKHFHQPCHSCERDPGNCAVKIHSNDFRVHAKKFNIHKQPTSVARYFKSKLDYQEILEKHTKQLSDLQSLLYADDRYAVLLIFQAMDAAGKDGAIKHVMSGVNPQGCQVFSFKHPSATDLN